MTRIEAPKQLRTKSYVRGFTHSLYRYPAAAPPELIREIIESHSQPGDLILDPFMGGGTTIVEAVAHGRRALGVDANTLALFVTRAKTTPLSAAAWAGMDRWLASRPLRHPRLASERNPRWHGLPVALRNRVRSGLASLEAIDHPDAARMARCCLLRLAQWSIESQGYVAHGGYVPTLPQMEDKLQRIVFSAREGMAELVAAARDHGYLKSHIVPARRLRVASVWEPSSYDAVGETSSRVRLVLTSPPYPGVHVLYHRWQVESRRETAAPYWITNTRDGFGASYYTMGSRSALGQENYFRRLSIAFSRIRHIMTRDGLVAQLVAFNNPEIQLPLFLAAMDQAKFELAVPLRRIQRDMTRDVPNRRWYARDRASGSGREVLLLHRLR